MADNGGADVDTPESLLKHESPKEAIKKAPALTELIGADICFSLPDWFPERRFDYRVYETYPEYHPWHGQHHEKRRDNSAVKELYAMPFVREVNTTNVCGNYVLFHLDDIDVSRLQEAIGLIEKILITFLKKWKKEYDEHPEDCICRKIYGHRCNSCLNCGSALNDDIECPTCNGSQEELAEKLGAMKEKLTEVRHAPR